jgi:hypothetical protein
LAQPSYNTLCYKKSAPTGASFMIGIRFSNLNGRVYQYNATSGLFDFGLMSGAANQMWRLPESQTQLINQFTNLPLAVDGNVERTFESLKGDVLITNPLTSKVFDCYGAGTSPPGTPCMTWTRNALSSDVVTKLHDDATDGRTVGGHVEENSRNYHLVSEDEDSIGIETSRKKIDRKKWDIINCSKFVCSS